MTNLPCNLPSRAMPQMMSIMSAVGTLRELSWSTSVVSFGLVVPSTGLLDSSKSIAVNEGGGSVSITMFLCETITSSPSAPGTTFAITAGTLPPGLTLSPAGLLSGAVTAAGTDTFTIVASTMITYEWSDWRNGVVWWIQSVYVAPEARGQGVYKGLYAYVQELANDDPNIRGIRLYVDKRNTRAQQVYAKLGMNGEHYQVFEWMK